MLRSHKGEQEGDLKQQAPECAEIKERNIWKYRWETPKIGADNSGYELMMGKHGLQKMSENGELLVDHRVIGGSVFPHKDIHGAIWRSTYHVMSQ